MAFKKMLKEMLNLLYWTMLAANTVGPGTVVICARAGAEFQLHLVWALIFASILAYTLQEGTARLTIVSGKGLGECLQLKYSNGRKFWNVGLFCWLIIGLVFIGNTLYECNNFAGGMAALYSLPPVKETALFRWCSCIAYAAVVFAILYTDQVKSLGVGLGVVTISMVILFLILTTHLGLDIKRLAKSFIFVNIPSGSINIVLSLVGTTSIGFNLFLGSEMARGRNDLPSAQRGIAFSTAIAFFISILIVIIGDGTHGKNKGAFTMRILVNIIEVLSGKAGRWVFGVGFIAAALSSMLAVPLGAAMTADSFLTMSNCQGEDSNSYCCQNNSNEREDSNSYCPQNNSNEIQHESELVEIDVFVKRAFPRKYYIGMMFVIVIVATFVIGANTPQVLIILIAQVFNGCLLPLFSTCLLICINDPRFMKKSPQKGWANCFLIIGVWMTIFLTSNSIIQNVFGWIVTEKYGTLAVFQRWRFIISALSSTIILLLTVFLTDLKRNLKRSFSKSKTNEIDTVAS